MALNAGSKTPTAIKICGITKTSQAQAIANLGVNAIGVIGVRSSPRYVSSYQRRKIFSSLEVVLICRNNHKLNNMQGE